MLEINGNKQHLDTLYKVTHGVCVVNRTYTLYIFIHACCGWVCVILHYTADAKLVGVTSWTNLGPLSELLIAVTIVKLLALLPGEAGTLREAHKTNDIINPINKRHSINQNLSSTTMSGYNSRKRPMARE